jgi:hypothetical protein
MDAYLKRNSFGVETLLGRAQAMDFCAVVFYTLKHLLVYQVFVTKNWGYRKLMGGR